MTYDAIVIGAGHNGLTLAAYLERGGLSTIVIERGHKVGGMAMTEEPLLPGFRHNTHANYLLYHDVMPVVRDFDLERHGLRTVTPRGQHGIAFADGRPPVVLHRPDMLDRTRASIRRHSATDAATYVELRTRAMTLEGVIGAGMFSPFRRSWFEAQEEAVETAYGDLGITRGLGAKSSRAVIDELFESDEMRALLYQGAAEFGVAIDQVGGAFAMLAFVFWTLANWKLPVGGMSSVADALHQACRREGVAIRTGAPVEQVVVNAGTAVGVRLAGGDEVRSRKLVVSSAGVSHTLLDLVGGQNLRASTVAEVEAFTARSVPSVASLAFCLREPPAHRSARWDPDIDRCFHTLIGFDGGHETLTHLREVEAGLLPRPGGAVRVNSLWDPSQAPAGLHVAGADVVLPSYSYLSEAEWAEVRDAYDDAFITRWMQAAPNMTAENVIAHGLLLAGDYERKVLLREGASQYQTDVGGLYLCGASTHPGGGIHGGCGYNAYQAIAEEIELPPLPLRGPSQG